MGLFRCKYFVPLGRFSCHANLLTHGDLARVRSTRTELFHISFIVKRDKRTRDAGHCALPTSAYNFSALLRVSRGARTVLY
jgi:hypothetical protein